MAWNMVTPQEVQKAYNVAKDSGFTIVPRSRADAFLYSGFKSEFVSNEDWELIQKLNKLNDELGW